VKRFFIKTFGCQMNVYDSSRIADILNKLGYRQAEELKTADLVIFNTCHIREKAAEKVFSDLGRLHLLKQEREAGGLDTIIGLTGCVAQAEGEQLAKRVPYVDFALGPLAYHRLPEVLATIAHSRGQPIIDTDFPAVSKFDSLPENTGHGGCSYLAVQEGCNKFCTYCVVPYTRGREYSRPLKEVMLEAKRLIATGTLELNLLGQNVNAYHGEDAAGQERNLAYLLRELAQIDGLKRIRYTTSYPSEMNDDLIACHKDLAKLMPYLHLPVQSGSDKVLKAMNRRHTAKDYLTLIDKLKKANPQIGMSSDFIVGFPGEDEQDFQATLDLVNEVKFIQAFSFKYSPRPRTPAALLKNQIAEKIKKSRLDTLQTLLFSYQEKFNKSCLNQTMPVLFESHGRKKGQLLGRTPYMQNLHTLADESLLNRIIDVKITKATTNSLTGEII